MPIIEEPEPVVEVAVAPVVRKTRRKQVGKQIPMVIYRHGARIEVGKAFVNEDGSLDGQIALDNWPEIKDYFLPSVGEFSLVPKRTTVVNVPSATSTVRDPIKRICTCGHPGAGCDCF